jgi:hypothetical protein
MSRLVFIFLCFLQLSAFTFAANRVTVDELSKLIASSKGDQDSKIAGHLSTIELSERLNAAKLASMEAALPGPESRRALVMLADQATFLAPPASEIPNNPIPGFAEQRAMIAKTIEYVRVMQVRLPDLFANRDTIYFEDTPPGLKAGSTNGFNPAQPLHPVSRTAVTVLYRDGQDFVQLQGKEQPATSLATKGLASFGEFGPILSTVLVDLPHGKLAWSHWEQGTKKPIAVFGFSVSKISSHYAVRFCCVGAQPFQQFSAYHGEMSINPDDGTILRLTLLADLAPDDPITKADVMVEYGPVELGGRTFFCPRKSISVSCAMDQAAQRGAMSNGTGTVDYRALAIAEAPKQTMVNEVVFDHYHLFQSESRVVTAENSAPAPAADTAETAAAASNITAPRASAAPPADADRMPAVSYATNTPSTEAVASAAPAPSASTVPPAPATLELRITPQQTPTIPDAALNEAKFSLHVITRSVEVSVAAFDKKGQPVTDLKPEDFEIYDGGRKQTVHSFERPVSHAPPLPAAVAAPQFGNEYSNRGGASLEAAGKVSTGSRTIIFFDATSLQFNDLANARQQVLKILGTLPASEPVGLYVRIGFGFRVLLEATTDRAVLTAALSAWKPDARDLARAQEAEQRNRQQFDSLRNPNSVMFTYAMVGGSGGGPMGGSDPKLYNLGEEPAREALSVLIAVAAHMGAIPGHKNLVWLASDNVLADWSDQSADGDEGRMGPNGIGKFSIPTQEALNNAHVSLYAFDASQLETAATDASLQNDGVQLDPSVKDNFPEFKAPPGGRSFTQLRTATHTVQIAMQQLAESTGGRAFGRSSNVISNLNRVIDDSQAIYQLSFSPDTQPDDKYHQIKVMVSSRRDITLRYRTGYLYSKEPATLKERFTQVLWQPFDASEISITARRAPASGGAAVTLRIAANDVGLMQSGDRWNGKLNVFLVQRDDTGAGAFVKEQTLTLDLSAATRQKFLSEGIPFEQYLDAKQNAANVRLIVVDENSGRIGSITLPVAEQSASN